MSTARFGELLGRLVTLTSQDVSDILEEQTMSHRRFGQIAMSWGLCQPEHVWEAWCDQLGAAPERVDLEAIGIDTQALAQLQADIARQFRVLPVRSLGDRLILATTETSLKHAADHLPGLLGKRIQFVLADPRQVDQAIRAAYLCASECSRN